MQDPNRNGSGLRDPEESLDRGGETDYIIWPSTHIGKCSNTGFLDRELKNLRRGRQWPGELLMLFDNASWLLEMR